MAHGTYDLDAVRATHGSVPTERETFDVGRAKYDAIRAARRADALGGARIVVRHPADLRADSNESRSSADTDGTCEPNESQSASHESQSVSSRPPRVLFGYETAGAEWDVPGGGRESGEMPAATARRELREECGIGVTVTGVVRAMRFRFAHENEPTVGGWWVYFAGVAESTGIEPDDTELADADWFRTPPADCNRHARAAVERLRD